MPKFNIEKRISPDKSFRVNSVCSNHDVSVDEFSQVFAGDIAIEDKAWNIGLIVGRSGSGKSTISKECFGEETRSKFVYDSSAVIDDFEKKHSTEDIFKTLNRVGFGSPPSWLKNYSVLSNGEKMRVDLARAILSDDDIIVFDEYTSVVDRNVAKFGAAATQKAIRAMDKKFVAVACHRDIIDWLEPDWIYDTDEKRFFFTQKTKDQSDQHLMSKLERPPKPPGILIESFTI